MCLSCHCDNKQLVDSSFFFLFYFMKPFPNTFYLFEPLSSLKVHLHIKVHLNTLLLLFSHIKNHALSFRMFLDPYSIIKPRAILMPLHARYVKCNIKIFVARFGHGSAYDNSREICTTACSLLVDNSTPI